MSFFIYRRKVHVNGDIRGFPDRTALYKIQYGSLGTQKINNENIYFSNLKPFLRGFKNKNLAPFIGMVVTVTRNDVAIGTCKGKLVKNIGE